MENRLILSYDTGKSLLGFREWTCAPPDVDFTQFLRDLPYGTEYRISKRGDGKHHRVTVKHGFTRGVSTPAVRPEAN